MNSRKLAVTAILGAAVLTVSSTMAQELGVNFSGGGYFQSDYAYTLGYEFQVTTPVTVVGLAALDPASSLIGVNVVVGLWQNGGNLGETGSLPGPLLTSAIISAGTLPTMGAGGQFAEVAITPIVLTPGLYEVAATDPDFILGGGTAGSPLTGLTVAPGINYVEDSYANGTSLTYPGNSELYLYGSGFYGWFGGNIVIASSTSSVPDASSALVLLSGACLALGALRRKFA
jgi:hypothetical protein